MLELEGNFKNTTLTIINPRLGRNHKTSKTLGVRDFGKLTQIKNLPRIWLGLVR